MASKHSPQNYLYSDMSVQRACEKIEADLSVKHAVRALAKHAGLAEHHFQRRFAAATGETVAGYLKARRLEKAAIALLHTTDGILDISMQFGFETHSAFSRAFKIQFGMTPAQFRKSDGRAPKQGEHPRPYLIPHAANTELDRFDLIQGEETWLCWRKFTGVENGRFFIDLTELGRALAQLREECIEKDVQTFLCDGPQIASAFFQGPNSFEDENAVAHSGALFDEQISLDWPDGWTKIPARTYAVFPHFGPLLTLPLTWNKAARVALKPFGLKLDQSIMFETYLTSKPNEAPSKLSALIYLPVSKAEQEQKLN